MELISAFLDFILNINLCIVMFLAYFVIISVSGTLVNFLKGIVPLPHFFLQAFKFGKMAHNIEVNNIISYLEVPKRWFIHFYISASILVTMALLQMWNIYFLRAPLPSWVNVTLDIFTTPERKPAISATTAVLGLSLLALQIYRRLYENLFVSVFSSGRMNILHYIVGNTHYFGAVLLLVSQAPGFDGKESRISFTGITFRHIIGTLVCLFGFAVQNHSLYLLASLRKNKGREVTEGHVMPRGGMFQIVSCPHMFAEVLIYVGILIILHMHIGWGIVTLWVISNQVHVAVMNHKWYQNTFKDYPLKRRAIFPFIL